ncbi:beta-propeller fold lactonase family protein [Streptomyces yanii]|uniref:Beta-propeller fold lactonase family protein n=1 Tax=Streptomyces yanii TaxID=78510 RepID=A0ABV5R7T8_9ACTN
MIRRRPSIPAPGSFRVRAAGPASQSGGQNLPAQLTLSDDGRFAYLANHGPDTIAVFDLTTDTPIVVGEYGLGTVRRITSTRRSPVA